ncbi:MAG: 30S ribosomal protein S2 [Candidatus Pacebacteria bacterium]|jgi:small subunit ribosomal protein S2|nr:30S ribosomal protein S2 [Candidatus Paceibacterota bacterium]
MTEDKKQQLVEQEEIKDSQENDFEMMKKAGLQFGHKKTYNHPQAGYFTVKSSTELSLIDLDETKKGLESALNFIKEIIKEKGTILFVGAVGGAKEGVKDLCQKYDLPYVTNRWLGGTLTNFQTLSERIKYLEELENKKKTGDWGKYTKQEQRKLEEEMDKLEEKFVGLKNMSRLPEALFIIDPKTHDTALREAQKKGIPVISILDTDDDPTEVNYPIPANDSAKSSIGYILNKVDQVLEQTINNKE